ncbi:protein DA1-related 1-like isoform X2 [Quercus robur]|uniref:protein DA1-related 1-like isoform X2 n=1 Tax=Quercus robur TaxID=38942 RepID=UPI0021633804|nr:protein DA1-related 1-like isoform X2 [Quercus robur]
MKDFKGSSHRGQYHGNYADERIWDGARSSVDEDLECAVAMSLSEQDQKGKNVIEEDEHVSKAQLVEDEQLAKALQESYPLEEDEQLAKTLQESYPLEEDEQLAKTLQESYPFAEDEQLAKALQESSLLAKAIQESCFSEEDELLAKAIHESQLESPPQYGICASCNTEISPGKILRHMDAIWHAECFRCHACNLPIKDHEFSTSGKHRFHKSCRKKLHSPICDVCKNFIPKNSAGLIECRERPFWKQQFCPSHEHDRTPLCCSCERMETRDRKYLLLDDGRKLCLECLDSAVMDTNECQPLYIEIQNFYEGLHMKVEQKIPMLLVQRQALNVAMDGEKNGHHHMRETRGLCLSEEQTVTTISRGPRMADNQFIDMITEPRRLIRSCEVTAILVLYGLPRLLTGSILAHEMMHAWLRLKGYPNLSPEVEEGICQVLAHMWMESEILSASGSDVASSSSSLSPSSSSSSKKGKRSEFEKKLGEFFKHQIETDETSAYGDGFRKGNKAVVKYGLETTLKHIQMTKNFPY